MTEYRQCFYCGRRGTRQFLTMGSGNWICKRKRSCDRRRRAFNRGFVVRAKL